MVYNMPENMSKFEKEPELEIKSSPKY